MLPLLPTPQVRGMTSLRASADKFLLGGEASIILQLRELSAKYPTYALVMYLIYIINRWELFALTASQFIYLFVLDSR